MVKTQPRDARGRFVKPLRGATNIKINPDGTLSPVNLGERSILESKPLWEVKRFKKIHVRNLDKPSYRGRIAWFVGTVLATYLAGHLGITGRIF